MIYLSILLVLLYLSQEFVRKWFFFRAGKYSLDHQYRSPVDGTVCYVRPNSDFISKKRWANVRIGRMCGDWCQIGIYMSGFDRHFVISPAKDKVLFDKKLIGHSNDNVSMIDFWQFIKYYYFGMVPKLVDTSPNHTLVYYYTDTVGVPVSMAMAVIADKFVGKLIDVSNKEPDIECYIRRGSQTDIFLPMSLYDKITVKVGDRVKIGDKICST